MNDGLGAKLRDRRLKAKIAQAHLARQIGISASYLNLIEHDRRPVGGALLGKIAQALGVDSGSLSGEADRKVISRLDAIGRSGELSPEALDCVANIAEQFPEWAHLICGQSEEVSRLKEITRNLSDRLAHDPKISAAMHEVLTVVSALRSTASILVGTPELDANWLRRFHTNLDEDSRRLAKGVEAIVASLDPQSQQGVASIPMELAFDAIEGVEDHLHILERGEDLESAVTKVLEQTTLVDKDAIKVFRRNMKTYARDAHYLPRGLFLEVCQSADFHPARVAHLLGRPLDMVMRRLAAISTSVDAPDTGLLVCDASGAVIYKRSLEGWDVPRLGFSCPVLPIFASFSRPGQLISSCVVVPDGTPYETFSVAASNAKGMMQAYMLVRAAPSTASDPIPVGPACRVCPRLTCRARREPSLFE